MTPGTFVAGEAASLTPIRGEYHRAMYLPPNGASNATFLGTLRLLLVHESARLFGRLRPGWSSRTRRRAPGSNRANDRGASGPDELRPPLVLDSVDAERDPRLDRRAQPQAPAPASAPAPAAERFDASPASSSTAGLTATSTLRTETIQLPVADRDESSSSLVSTAASNSRVRHNVTSTIHRADAPSRHRRRSLSPARQQLLPPGISPSRRHDFSPLNDTLRIQAALTKAELAGVQLATEQGKPVGWIVEPQRRRFLTLRWDGRLNGARVADGSYLIRLVERGRTVASSPLRIDQTPPRITDIRARNRSREPFQGDNDRLTTISSNGDGLRESAKIAPHAQRASARALRGDTNRELARDRSRADGQSPARTAHVHLAPALVGRRAHVSRPAHCDRRRRQPPHVRRRQRPRGTAAQVRGRAGPRRRRRLHPGELHRHELGAPADRDGRDLVDAADVPGRAGGHPDAQRHADERRPGQPSP